MTQSKWFLAAILLGISTMALAHHAWLEPAPDAGFVIVWGHPGHIGSYNPNYVTGVTLLGVDGQALAVQQSAGAKGVHIQTTNAADETVGLAAFTFESGNTIKTVDGEYRHGSKQDYEDYARAFYSVVTGKSLFAWDARFAEPVGLELEIVPLANPYTLDQRQQLPVRVLYRGQPLSDAKVHYVNGVGKPATATTNAQGRASLAIDVSQLRIITVAYSVPLPNNQDVDERSIRSYLYIYPRETM